MSDPRIPWANGELVFKHIAPANSPEGNASLGPGRWCLHPRSTVPFVSIKTAQTGDRTITWGDTIDVPEGQKGRISNASFHAGDIVLAATGSGASAPTRPGSVTIATQFAAVVLEGVPSYLSGPLDVRMVRRAYLWLPTALAPAAPASVLYQVQHRGSTRGEAFGTGVVLAAAGVFTDFVPLTAFGTSLPLGIGSGRNLDTLGRSLAELRPMAFRDWLTVAIPSAVADPLGVGVNAPAFFEVEY